MGDVNDLLPDLATPANARRIRAPKHDFKNGEGRVFAHRHSNGNGWVADTAHVAESVLVTSSAGVYGYARVTDGVQLTARARVGDYARVMHRVKLSGDVHVRGTALVRDGVNLTGNVFVCGQAELSGGTTADGKAHISDWALVHNTRLNGPKVAYTLEIQGNAKIFDSTLYGPCKVSDSALLQNSTLNYGRCTGAGKLLNSTANTSIDQELVPWIHGYGRRRRRANSALDLSRAPSLEGRMIAVQGILINSCLTMRPCAIAAGACLVNCNLSLYNQDLAQLFPEFPDGVLADFRTANLGMLIARYRPAEVAAAAPIPVIAAVGVVPSFDQPRQRRLMRMEDA